LEIYQYLVKFRAKVLVSIFEPLDILWRHQFDDAHPCALVDFFVRASHFRSEMLQTNIAVNNALQAVEGTGPSAPRFVTSMKLLDNSDQLDLSLTKRNENGRSKRSGWYI